MEGDFLGTGWAFPPTFYADGAAVEMATGEEDIHQSLNILLSTALTERVMQSDYGCELSWFLFEEIEPGLVSEIRNLVAKAILRHEPRVEVKNIDVTEREDEKGVLIIHVDYLVRTTNNRFNLVFPFYLNEAAIQP